MTGPHPYLNPLHPMLGPSQDGGPLNKGLQTADASLTSFLPGELCVFQAPNLKRDLNNPDSVQRKVS